MVKMNIVSKLDQFIFDELYVQKGKHEGQKTKKNINSLRSRQAY